MNYIALRVESDGAVSESEVVSAEDFAEARIIAEAKGMVIMNRLSVVFPYNGDEENHGQNYLIDRIGFGHMGPN